MEDLSYVPQDVETRRVQLTGGATLIVSLPKEWTRQVKLKPGDEVLIVPQPDRTLLIVPKKSVKTPLFEAKLEISSELARDLSRIERLLISYYLSGVDLLKIEFKEDFPEVRKFIKRVIREKLTGIEVIEESRNQLVLQNLVSISETDVHSLLLKMLKTVLNMLHDLKIALEKEDTVILSDLIERDCEVDRFHWFLRRILKKILASGRLAVTMSVRDPRSILEYSTISRMLERIADNVSEIAQEFANKLKDKIRQIPQVLKRELIDIVQREYSHLEQLMSYLASYRLNSEDLNNLIDLTRREVLKKIEQILSALYSYGLDNQLATDLRLVLYNLMRISEYTIDIAEALLDLVVDSMVKVH